MVFRILFIDEKLRLTLLELETFFRIKLDKAEIERVFVDAENDQISNKNYRFYQERSLFFPWKILGVVDEYEPDTLFLQSSGGFGKNKKFEDFFARHE
ncbi:hypothetical protein [Hymenobacter terrenus]|uniref:hypothetical protein n=1 Tax=Hymenobacter terrenus TaxID=1629124 RepID=UPI000619A833|nr:hypothetical protein [Hymenobacter terrenus]